MPSEALGKDSSSRGAAGDVVNDLEESVTLAIRRAVAGTLARHLKQPALPQIDMDFAGGPGGEPPGPRKRRGPERLVAGAMAALIVASAAPVLWPHIAGWLATASLVPLATSAPPQQPAPPAAEAPWPSLASMPDRSRVEPREWSGGSQLLQAGAGPRPADPKRSVPPAATRLAAPEEAAVAAEPLLASPAERAHMLVGVGRVREARAVLAAPAANGDLDALLALARSYDPNILGKLERSDAAADAKEAERLYRDWYALSVKGGHVSANVRFENLINSLAPDRDVP